jgi:hypothetical protein
VETSNNWKSALLRAITPRSTRTLGSPPRPRGAEFFCALARRADDNFFTYDIWPKRFAGATTFSAVSRHTGLVGIVIQGPVIREDAFTFETIRRYNTCFPDALVILSTWEGMTDERELLRHQLRCELVVSKQPANPGPANINLQLESTARGLELAARASCDYILKTRTDQRFYHEDLLHYLRTIQDQFSLSGASISYLSSRLIISSLNTFKYRPYGISDMFMFGRAADVIKYWTTEPDARESVNAEPLTFGEHAKQRYAECYVSASFFEGVEIELDGTVQQSLELIAANFVVLDSAQLKQFWPKYTWRYDRWHALTGDSQFTEISFSDWLDWYCHGVSIDPKTVRRITTRHA